MHYLFILNDAPYGSERTYNGLRLANSLAGREGDSVSIFLMGDAVSSGVAGQKTPNGYYNIERMLKLGFSKGARVSACGSCLEARGIADAALAEGVERGSMEKLTAWTREADRVLAF